MLTAAVIMSLLLAIALGLTVYFNRLDYAEAKAFENVRRQGSGPNH